MTKPTRRELLLLLGLIAVAAFLANHNVVDHAPGTPQHAAAQGPVERGLREPPAPRERRGPVGRDEVGNSRAPERGCGERTREVVMAVDVRDVEVLRVPAKPAAHPQRLEELKAIAEPIREIREDPHLHASIAGSRRPRAYARAGATPIREPRPGIAGVRRADRDSMPAPDERCGQDHGHSRDAAISPGALEIGNDLENARSPHRGPP
jgi:hypothetical protein